MNSCSRPADAIARPQTELDVALQLDPAIERSEQCDERHERRWAACLDGGKHSRHTSLRTDAGKNDDHQVAQCHQSPALATADRSIVRRFYSRHAFLPIFVWFEGKGGSSW